jgi:hypothetical protein
VNESLRELAADVERIQAQTLSDLEDRAEELLFEVVHGDVERVAPGRPLFDDQRSSSVQDEDGRVSDRRRELDDRLLGPTYAEVDVAEVGGLEGVPPSRIGLLRRSAGQAWGGIGLPDDRVPMPRERDATRPARKRTTALARKPRIDEDPIDIDDSMPFQGRSSDQRGFDRDSEISTEPDRLRLPDRRARGVEGSPEWLAGAALAEVDRWDNSRGLGPWVLDKRATEWLQLREMTKGGRERRATQPPDQSGRIVMRRPEAAAQWLSRLSDMPLADLAAQGMPPGRPTSAQGVVRERLRAIILYLRRRDTASVYDIATALGRSPRAVEKLIKQPKPVVRMAPVVARAPVAHPPRQIVPTTHDTLTEQAERVGVVGLLGGARGLFAEEWDAS